MFLTGKQPFMKRRCQRRALAAERDVGTPEIADRGNAGARGYDVRITDLQGEWPFGMWLVPQCLSMTAYSGNVIGTDTARLQQRNRGVSETLANPLIKVADGIDSAFGRASRCLQQRRAKFVWIGCGLRRENFTSTIPEFDQDGIDAVHTGTGH